MNVVVRKLIKFCLVGAKMHFVMECFKQWCDLPNIQSAINANHIFISKPSYFPNDYFCQDIKGYDVRLFNLW
jgi:hypothetical protein